MPAKHVIIANGPAITPGAVATAQDWTVTGKTQGPCDYINAHVIVQETAVAGLCNGVMAGIDRMEVTIDASADSQDANTGSIFYTMFGGAAVPYAAAGCFTHGMLETVSRMLFHCDCLMDGVPLGTAAVHVYGAVIRLPIGKNVPVTVSVRTYMSALANWQAAGAMVYTGGFLTTVLYAHLVDGCADLKISQTAKTGFGPQADSELINIPDKPGYWFVGYSLDIRPAAGTTYVDRLGGGSSGPTVTADGWVRLANADGIVFDHASGQVIKADMLERNSPYHNWLTLDLYSDRLYGLGQYSRLMVAPISAESLTLTIHPRSDGVATDLYRIWYFYSKKGQRIMIVNAQQQQTSDFGAAGQTSAQETKK